MVSCISVTGIYLPEVEEIHPLIIMNRQRCFKEPDSLAQTGALAGIPVAESSRQDWVAHQNAIAQPTPANHETGQHRSARDLRKQKWTKREGGWFGKKRTLGAMTRVVDAVPLDGHDFIPAQSLQEFDCGPRAVAEVNDSEQLGGHPVPQQFLRRFVLDHARHIDRPAVHFKQA